MRQAKPEAIGTWLRATGPARLIVGGATMAAGYGWLGALLAGIAATPSLGDLFGLMVPILTIACSVPALADKTGEGDEDDAAKRSYSLSMAIVAGTPLLLMWLWSLGIAGLWRPETSDDFGAVCAALVLALAGAGVMRPRRRWNARERVRNPRRIGDARRDRTLTVK